MLDNLDNEVIFKKSFTNITVFKAFVRDILGIEIEVNKIETEKKFAPVRMKIMLSIFVFSVLFCACKQTKTPQNPALIDTLRKAITVDIVSPKISETDTILQDALALAIQNIDKKHFSVKYETSIYEKYTAEIDIHLSNHFTKNKSHLIIRRREGLVYIDIYLKNKDKFEKILSYEDSPINGPKDTICDINGDGLKDFVVNWYGSNGCCLKAFSEVYLLKPDKTTFFDKIQFFNPTFSPTEKIVRGVYAGFAGESTMYKYKWNEKKLDTLEEVSYEKNKKDKKTGKVLIKKYKGKQIVIIRKNDVPNEYKKIYGYNWFTGNFP